jgi:hypothetical protein
MTESQRPKSGATADEPNRAISAPAAPVTPSGNSEFPLEWYKLHRQHELELNKATLSYEQERFRFLAYLNGGAAAAFVTLLASLWKDVSRPNLFSYVALVLWITGLLIAWGAWSYAHRGQSEIHCWNSNGRPP